MSDADDYYNRQSKRDSEVVAGWCFAAIALMIVGGWLYGAIQWVLS